MGKKQPYAKDVIILEIIISDTDGQQLLHLKGKEADTFEKYKKYREVKG